MSTRTEQTPQLPDEETSQQADATGSVIPSIIRGGRVHLPPGLTGVLRDIPPASVVMGRLRGLRRVGG